MSLYCSFGITLRYYSLWLAFEDSSLLFLVLTLKKITPAPQILILFNRHHSNSSNT